MRALILGILAIGVWTVLGAPRARAQTPSVMGWLSENDSQVYVISHPPFGTLSHIDGVDIRPGDTLVLGHGGCVSVGGKWIPYAFGEIDGVQYHGTVSIPGVFPSAQDLGSNLANGIRLVVKPVKRSRCAHPPCPVRTGLYLGYSPADAQVGYDGPPKPTDPNDPCSSQPDAFLTMTVIPSTDTLVQRLLDLTPAAGAFDTVQLPHSNDLNSSLPANPLFSDQLTKAPQVGGVVAAACGAAGANPCVFDAQTIFAGLGVPYAEWNTTCHGFPLNSFDADYSANPGPVIQENGPGNQTIDSTSPCTREACVPVCESATDCSQPMKECFISGANCTSDADCSTCSGDSNVFCNPNNGKCNGDPQYPCVTNADCQDKGGVCVGVDCEQEATKNLLVYDLMNSVSLRLGFGSIFGGPGIPDFRQGTCSYSPTTRFPHSTCESTNDPNVLLDCFPKPTDDNGSAATGPFGSNDSCAINLAQKLCGVDIACEGNLPGNVFIGTLPSSADYKLARLIADLESLQTLSNEKDKLLEGQALSIGAPLIFRYYDDLDPIWRFLQFRGTADLPTGQPAVWPQAISDYPNNTCRNQPADPIDQSRLCAVGHFIAPNASGKLTGFGGHVNLNQATFVGRLRFESHSGPPPVSKQAPPPAGQPYGWDDDDFNWDLQAPAGEGAGGGYGWIHVEHSALDSVEEFWTTRLAMEQEGLPVQNDFWTDLYNARLRDNTALGSWVAIAKQNKTDPAALACKKDGDCAAGKVCTAGYCELSCGFPVKPCKLDEDCISPEACTAGNCLPPCNAPSCIYPDQNMLSYLEGAAGNGTGLLDKAEYSGPNVVLNRTIGRQRYNVKSDGTIQECTVPASLPGGKGIVIGELSLDCYHGCQPEVHPAYALFVKRKTEFLGESWSFFVRRGGNEGMCSSGQEHIQQCGFDQCTGPFASPQSPPLPGLDTSAPLKFFIPRVGIDSVIPWFNVVAATCDSSGTCQRQWGAGGSSGSGRVQVDVVPGQGAIVTVDLGADANGGDVAWLEGDFDLHWSFLPCANTAHPGASCLSRPVSPGSLQAEVDRHYIQTMRLQQKQYVHQLPGPPPGPHDARPSIQNAAQLSSDPELKDLAVHLAASAGSEPDGDHEVITSFIGDPMFRVLAQAGAEAPATYLNYQQAIQDMNQSLIAKYNLNPTSLGCPGTPKIHATVLNPDELFAAPSVPTAGANSGANTWWQAFQTKQSEAIGRSKDVGCDLLSAYADQLPFPCDTVVPWPSGASAPAPQFDPGCVVDPGILQQGHLCVGAAVVLKRLTRFSAQIDNPGALCAPPQEGDTVDIIAPNGDVVVGFVTSDPAVLHIEGTTKALSTLFHSASHGAAQLTKGSDGKIYGQPLVARLTVPTRTPTALPLTPTRTPTSLVSPSPTAGPVCGNGICEPGEQCDYSGNTCSTCCCFDCGCGSCAGACPNYPSGQCTVF